MKGGEGGKEECFGYGVPPPFPGTWGRGIIKVLSENEDMVPALGVAGDPPPRTQGSVTPPPRVWYIQGGSRLPWRANKGVQGPAQSAAMG